MEWRTVSIWEWRGRLARDAACDDLCHVYGKRDPSDSATDRFMEIFSPMMTLTVRGFRGRVQDENVGQGAVDSFIPS